MILRRLARPSLLRALAGPVVLAACALALAGCGADQANVTVVLAESGPLAPYGKSIRQGMDAAFQAIDAKGGVLGGTEPLHVTFVDDGSSGTAAADAIAAALGGDALAVLGPIGNDAFLAARTVADEEGGAVISPYASANASGIGTSSLFRTYPSASLEMNRLVALLRKEVFVKDVVLFSSRSTTGRAFKGAFVDSFQHLRGNVQATVSFQDGVNDAQAAELVQELRTKPGDAAVLLCEGRDAATLIKALRGIDYVGEIFTTSAFHHRVFREAAGEAAHDVMYVAPAWDPAAPAAQAFTAEFRKVHGADPDVWAALGYDAVNTLAAAIDKAGGAYKSDLPPTLRSSQFRAEGVLGPAEFDGAGDIVARDLDVFAIQAGEPMGWKDYRPLWEARTKRIGGK